MGKVFLSLFLFFCQMVTQAFLMFHFNVISWLMLKQLDLVFCKF